MENYDNNQDQERFDYEVSREEWELENPWIIRCGTEEEAEGDFRHDEVRQAELDARPAETNKC